MLTVSQGVPGPSHHRQYSHNYPVLAQPLSPNGQQRLQYLVKLEESAIAPLTARTTQGDMLASSLRHEGPTQSINSARYMIQDSSVSVPHSLLKGSGASQQLHTLDNPELQLLNRSPQQSFHQGPPIRGVTQRQQDALSMSLTQAESAKKMLMRTINNQPTVYHKKANSINDAQILAKAYSGGHSASSLTQADPYQMLQPVQVSQLAQTNKKAVSTKQSFLVKHNNAHPTSDVVFFNQLPAPVQSASFFHQPSLKTIDKESIMTIRTDQILRTDSSHKASLTGANSARISVQRAGASGSQIKPKKPTGIIATGEPFIQHQRNRSDIIASLPSQPKQTGRVSFGQTLSTTNSNNTTLAAQQKATAAKKMHQKIQIYSSGAIKKGPQHKRTVSNFEILNQNFGGSGGLTERTQTSQYSNHPQTFSQTFINQPQRQPAKKAPLSAHHSKKPSLSGDQQTFKVTQQLGIAQPSQTGKDRYHQLKAIYEDLVMKKGAKSSPKHANFPITPPTEFASHNEMLAAKARPSEHYYDGHSSSAVQGMGKKTIMTTNPSIGILGGVANSQGIVAQHKRSVSDGFDHFSKAPYSKLAPEKHSSGHQALQSQRQLTMPQIQELPPEGAKSFRRVSEDQYNKHQRLISAQQQSSHKALNTTLGAQYVIGASSSVTSSRRQSQNTTVRNVNEVKKSENSLSNNTLNTKSNELSDILDPQSIRLQGEMFGSKPVTNNWVNIVDETEMPKGLHSKGAQKPNIQFMQINQKQQIAAGNVFLYDFNTSQAPFEDLLNEKLPPSIGDPSPKNVLTMAQGHKRGKSDAQSITGKKNSLVPILPLSSIVQAQNQALSNTLLHTFDDSVDAQIPSSIQKILKEFGHQDISLSPEKQYQKPNFIQIKDEEDGATPMKAIDPKVAANLDVSPVSISNRTNYPSPDISKRGVGGGGVSAQLWYKSPHKQPVAVSQSVIQAQPKSARVEQEQPKSVKSVKSKAPVFSGGGIDSQRRDKYLKLQGKYGNLPYAVVLKSQPISPTFGGTNKLMVFNKGGNTTPKQVKQPQVKVPAKQVSRFPTPIASQKQLVPKKTCSPSPVSKKESTPLLKIEIKKPQGVDDSFQIFTDELDQLTQHIQACMARKAQKFDTTIEYYRIGKVLGKGAFGKVNLAMHKLSKKFVAIKSINKQYLSLQQQQSLLLPGEQTATKKVMQEVLILKRIRHRNIVRLYEYFETEKHILFVMELCAGGDLLNYVRKRRRLHENQAKVIFGQLLSAIDHCHQRGILHRDIKLDNILLDAQSGDVKLCDFGVSKALHRNGAGWESGLTEQCGTPAYIAPEVLQGQGCDGFKADIWSAGVVLYAMLLGTVPFKANNMSELQKMIMKAKYTIKEDTSDTQHKPLSEESKELIKLILEKDPLKRLSIPQILDHPWMQQGKDEPIELFSQQERAYIRHEFTYNETSRLNRNEQHVSQQSKQHLFPEHLLDSTQNSMLKNCTSKSVILAPFNSTKSHIDATLSEGVKELLQSRRCIKMAGRVKDIDRQYERNNNADLDNGVYHKLEEDPPAADKSTFGKRELHMPDGSDKKQTDLEKLESLIQMEEQGNTSPRKIAATSSKQQEALVLQSAETVILDGEVVSEIVHRFNFPRDYMIRCLNNNELNYATTTYWLMVNPNVIGI